MALVGLLYIGGCRPETVKHAALFFFSFVVFVDPSLFNPELILDDPWSQAVRSVSPPGSLNLIFIAIRLSPFSYLRRLSPVRRCIFSTLAAVNQRWDGPTMGWACHAPHKAILESCCGAFRLLHIRNPIKSSIRYSQQRVPPHTRQSVDLMWLCRITRDKHNIRILRELRNLLWFACQFVAATFFISHHKAIYSGVYILG